MSTIFDLPEVGKEVTLFTHYAAKEDTVALYGFLREGERSLFRSLQKVSGIGAKIALAVLSGASVDEFARLVHTGDIAALTRIPGIGKKTAERIVVELRDRVDGIALASLGTGSAGAVPKDPVVEASSRAAAARLQAGRGSAPGQRRRRGRGRCRDDHPQGTQGRVALSVTHESCLTHDDQRTVGRTAQGARPAGAGGARRRLWRHRHESAVHHAADLRRPRRRADRGERARRSVAGGLVARCWSSRSSTPASSCAPTTGARAASWR